MIQAKKHFYLLILLLSLTIQNNAQETKIVNATKIETVTIFDGWAQIKRTFTLDLNKGTQHLVLKIKKNNVDLTRLAIIANNPDVKCVSIYAEEEKMVLGKNPISKTIETNTNDIENKIKLLEAEILSQQNALEMVEKLKALLLENISNDSVKEKVDVEEWKSSLNLLKEKAITIAGKTREMEVKKWQLQKDLENLNQNSFKFPTNAENPYLLINIEILSAKELQTTFTFSYFISGPTWRPEYEIRYDTLLQNLTFKYFAKVIQSTSEDWAGVNVILSTVNLEEAIALPDTPKKFLEINMTEKKIARIKTNKTKIGDLIVNDDDTKEIVKKLLIKEDDSNEIKPIKEDVYESLSSERIDQGIKITLPLNNVTLLSTYTIQKLLVIEKQFEFKTRIEIAPSESKLAYRRMSFTNNLGLIILPSNANLYLNGKPLGKVALPLVIPKAEASISFGIVQGLYGVNQIEDLDIKESKQENEKCRIIKYKLNLRNFTNEKITFRLYEMIPVSKIKDVNIIFDEKEIGFTTQLPGLIFQDITLTPSENKQIKIKYIMESKGEYTF